MQTNQELNEQVARKLGYKIREPLHADNPFILMKGGNDYSIAKEEIPAYSTSIEAAWEIVEKLGAQFHKMWRDWDTGEYIFEISDGVFHMGKPNVLAEGESDTAPMAICLAFLKLPTPPNV